LRREMPTASSSLHDPFRTSAPRAAGALIKRLRAQHQHAAMLGHVLGLDVNSHPRVLDFAPERAFEPVADVMCVSDTHPARHNQVKFHKCNLACAPSAEVMG